MLSKLLTFLFTLFFSFSTNATGTTQLLNVSFDPTNELYKDYNQLFGAYWKQKYKEDVIIYQSNGGSSAQARAIIEGLNADVATLALAYDIDIIAERAKLLPSDWQNKLPNNSCPYTSTIVFLVKKGNPKHIKDWSDLTRPGISVITPNPKTSGAARWNFLAAWGYALKKNKSNEVAAKEFVRKLFKNVPILDAGSRGSAITFTQRHIGDVLLTWESEAYLIINKIDKRNEFELVLPSVSILAEPPVAVIEKNTERNGTSIIANEYLKQLYSPQAQELIAKHYYRPTDKKIAAKFVKQFPEIPMFKVADFGGWEKAQETFFNGKGLFDQIYQK